MKDNRMWLYGQEYRIVQNTDMQMELKCMLWDIRTMQTLVHTKDSVKDRLLGKLNAYRDLRLITYEVYDYLVSKIQRAAR